MTSTSRFHSNWSRFGLTQLLHEAAERRRRAPRSSRTGRSWRTRARAGRRRRARRRPRRARRPWGCLRLGRTRARRRRGRGELVARCADEIDRADVRRQVADEGIEVLALERAAEDEAERRVVGRDPAARGGGVRRLRVVDPANAVQLAHELEPVRDAREGGERLRDGVVGHAGGAGRGGRGGSVLPVVTAGDQRLGGQRVVGGELDPVDFKAARDDLCARPLEDAELGCAVGVEACRAGRGDRARG